MSFSPNDPSCKQRTEAAICIVIAHYSATVASLWLV